LLVDDTERDFATRAFGVPSFTAGEPTATTKNGNAVSNVYLARLPPDDDAEAPDRRDAA
jgi:hypothetical protein